MTKIETIEHYLERSKDLLNFYESITKDISDKYKENHLKNIEDQKQDIKNLEEILEMLKPEEANASIK